MKRIIIMIASLLVFSGCSTFASDLNTRLQLLEGHIPNNNPTDINKYEQERCIKSSFWMRRGCCSWHGGVCSCNGRSVICCDGTVSPSCKC